MAVKVRMTRKGSKHSPFYRVVVADERSPRDGKYIELVGTYDPRTDPATVTLKMDRIDYWTKQGAQVSDTVTTLIKNRAAAQS